MVRNLVPLGGTEKFNTFWEQNIYIKDEKKDSEGLVYSVTELDKSDCKSRTLHRSNISYHYFPYTNHDGSPSNLKSNKPHTRKLAPQQASDSQFEE